MTADNASLETLLQKATRHHGADSMKTDTAVTGTADANTPPQPVRSAAPTSVSPPPAPLATVAVAIAQQAEAGAKLFEIRLDPPELGRVEVRIEVTREGHATTHLVVERSETLDMLQRDARQLERALQNAGLNTSDVDLIKDQGHAHHDARDNQPSQQRAGNLPPAEDAADEDWQPLPGRHLSSAGSISAFEAR